MCKLINQPLNKNEMKNLTEKQQVIIESLVAEFTNINEKFTQNEDNIFAHLVDDVIKDKKRIAEIQALNIVGKTAMGDQINSDYDKYYKMFDEIGIQMRTTDSSADRWELVTNKGKYTERLSGSNKLIWTYYTEENFNIILGERIYWVCGHHIMWSGDRETRYSNIEQLFAHPNFKDCLKQLINLV